MAMRKKGKYWYIRYHEYHRDENGKLCSKRIEKAAGTNKTQAAKLEAEKKQYWEAVKRGGTPPATFDEILESYLATQEQTRSYKSKLSSAKHLFPIFTGWQLADIKSSNLHKYTAKRQAEGAAGATINREIQLLSSAIKHANTLNGWELHNPCPGCRVKANPPRVRWLTDEEQDRLILAASQNYRSPLLVYWIIIAVNTGMRFREITELEWKRIDFENALIQLKPTDNKTEDWRGIPLNQRTIQAIKDIERWHQKKGLNVERLFVRSNGTPIKQIGEKSFYTACEKAGLDDLTRKDMRHVAATSMLQKGADLYQIKDVLGHKSVKTTEIYAHLAPHAARAAVEVLDQSGEKMGKKRKT